MRLDFIALGERLVLPAVLVAFGFWKRASGMYLETLVAAIAKDAGYTSFGATDGPLLSFRSTTTYLRVARGAHLSYIQGFLAARPVDPRAELEWIDDDLLRQVLLHEVPDAAGRERVWHDSRAFVRFLREHLPQMAAAVASADPSFHAAIARARAERSARRRHDEELVAEARRRRGRGA